MKLDLGNIAFPCEGCKDRSVGCHSSCPKYQKAKAINAEMQKKKRDEWEYNDYHTKAILKTMNPQKKYGAKEYE